jgi:hypothetical protein
MMSPASGISKATADALAADVRTRLPVTSRVDRLTLITGPPPWTVVRHFPLG